MQELNLANAQLSVGPAQVLPPCDSDTPFPGILLHYSSSTGLQEASSKSREEFYSLEAGSKESVVFSCTRLVSQ